MLFQAMTCRHCRQDTHHRRYCDECFLWWSTHSTHWKLWSVLETRHGSTLAAHVCQDDGMGKLICEYLVPASTFVVDTGSHIISLSLSSTQRGELLGMRTDTCSLQRLLHDFRHEPGYLHMKGFSVIKWGRCFHFITLDELSH